MTTAKIELPKEQQVQTRRLMRATLEESEKRLEPIARQLEYEYASAARSLREGIEGDGNAAAAQDCSQPAQVSGDDKSDRKPA